MPKMLFFVHFECKLSCTCMCNWMLWCREGRLVSRLRASILKSKLPLLDVFETHEAMRFNQYLAS